MGIFQRLFFGVVTLVVLGIGLTVYVLYETGQFGTITPHFNGQCAIVDGVVGGEDITIHPSGKFAFISSYDRRAAKAGNAVTGTLYRYDLDDPDAEPVDLRAGITDGFHPHGLSLYVDDTGRGSLLVINHKDHAPGEEGVDTIEVFELAGRELIHRQTIDASALLGANDILAVSHDRFYVTNDHGYRDGLATMLENLIPLPSGIVSYYDGAGFRTVADGFRFANGINMSADGSKVYVSTSVGQTLYSFHRDKATGDLTQESATDLETGLDNIEMDDQDRMWIVAHPQLLTFLGHAGDATKTTPTQILRFTRSYSGELVPEEIMMDAGDLVSGGTVAAAFGSRFLIGTAFESKILDCSL
ncbi:strictosidine synthase family protein [Sneathiella chinensis]|uniref:Arylesterase n=1 Tax=Sneathiella chinensis TaxID=349750 RepID=A0ABQ5U2G4_9PROT|nr:SMP-30/gluconolactonase/LRE family protein [Sneathiella chinensis]GLQ06307.1 arylesterase [Sneathiella chinensis]